MNIDWNKFEMVAIGTIGFTAFMVVVYSLGVRFLTNAQNQEAAAKKGDTVVTGGGIVGKVSRVIDDNYIEVEIVANTKIRIVKSTLTDVLDATGTAAND